MITTKLFEEFQSCLDKSIKEIQEPKNDYEKLFEWHFDIFGLIEKGLAIDINTLSDVNNLKK